MGKRCWSDICCKKSGEGIRKDPDLVENFSYFTASGMGFGDGEYDSGNGKGGGRGFGMYGYRDVERSLYSGEEFNLYDYPYELIMY